MYEVPGSCIRVAFVPEGTGAHSKEYLDAGKSDAAHRAVSCGAMILAGTAVELIRNPARRRAIQEEFDRGKKKTQGN